MIRSSERFSFQIFAKICCIAIGFAAVGGCNGSAIGTSVAPAGSAAAGSTNSIGGNGGGDQPICVSDGDCASLATSPCAIAVCEQTGHRCTVVNKADFAACAVADDLCASESACLAGACVAIRQKACDDGNPCTKDLCVAAKGCVNSPQSLVSCSDGNPCTLGDHCVVGTCTPKLNVCACNNGDDCQAFANKDKCAGTLQCSQGVCVSDPLQKVDCDDKNPCTKDSCDADTGQCLHNALKDGAICDDSDICTLGERCAASTRAPASAPWDVASIQAVARRSAIRNWAASPIQREAPATMATPAAVATTANRALAWARRRVNANRTAIARLAVKSQHVRVLQYVWRASAQ